MPTDAFLFAFLPFYKKSMGASKINTSHEDDMTSKDRDIKLNRRTILKAGASAATMAFGGLMTRGVWAAGSDKPEKEEVKVGVIPLSDCASVKNTASRSRRARKRRGRPCATSWSTASSTPRTCCTDWCTACIWAYPDRRKIWRC